MDTNNSHNPYIFIDNQRGYKVYSIFQRQKTEDNIIDANPLLNALKQRKGWAFENAKKELMVLLRNFVAAIKLLPKYDTIIMTPSNNILNKIVYGKNVLIFDDTVTTEKTISDSGEAICSMFIPKSITFITLFSALNDNENSQQKTNVVN